MSNDALWSGTFGNEYTVRNEFDYSPRRKFWGDIMYLTEAKSVLEVGCNTGNNLECIVDYLPRRQNAWGVDVNYRAIDMAHVRHKEINCVLASAYDLPFRDDYFDLVFTCGVLIHQTPDEVDIVMQEIIRTSAHYVLAVEYANDIFLEIPYRGNTGVLFKGPYGDIYEKKYGLRMIKSGRLGKEEGFDDTTWWLLSKV